MRSSSITKLVIVGALSQPVLAAAAASGAAVPLWRDPDWLAAIGQCVGAAATAIAAAFAYGAVKATSRAAKSRTEGQTVASLLTRYADPDMYLSLQAFGRFMGSVVPKKDRAAIAEAVKHTRNDDRLTVRRRYVMVASGEECAEEAFQALNNVLALLGYEMTKPRTAQGARSCHRPRKPRTSSPIVARSTIISSWFGQRCGLACCPLSIYNSSPKRTLAMTCGSRRRFL